MVDWNKVKGQALDLADKAKEKANEANENRKKSQQETKIKLVYSNMVQKKSTIIRKDVNGDYYVSQFYSEEAPRMDFENIEFEGSTITSKTSGTTETQGRMGSSLVGGALLGHTGAIIGSSRKKKGKINTTTTQEEKPGKGVLYLRDQDTKEIKPIKFQATESELNNYLRFFG